MWRPWRKKLAQADDRLREAERLRDQAQEQHDRVESLAPRVDAATSSLRGLNRENHFGPLIESILRGNE